MQNSGPIRPLSPHLQVYRPMYTMVLSILHRGSGVFLSMGSLLLVAWLVAIARGTEAFAIAGRIAGSAPLRAVLAGAIAAFWYHLFAGLRHLAWDSGLGFEPRTARRSGWIVVLLAATATAVTIARNWRWFAGFA